MMPEVSIGETCLLVLAAVFVILIYKWSSIIKNGTENSPPSPPKLPIIGNLHQLGSPASLPHRTLQHLSLVHGPLMLLHFGSIPVVVVSSAEAAHKILKTHDLAFSSRPKSIACEKLLYNYKDVATAPYGDYWRQMKSICMLNLLSNKKVQSFRGVREKETKSMINKIRETSSRGEVVNLWTMLMSLTNDVVCTVALGKKYHDDEEFNELSMELMETVGDLHIGDCIPWLGWVSRFSGLDAKYVRLTKRYDELLDIIIQEHIDKDSNTSTSNYQDHVAIDEKNKDFVDVLLEIQQENSLGFPIDKVSIKGVVLDMFLAGTDTTGTLVEWAMAELLKHPRVMSKLQKEVRSVYKKEEEILTDDDLVDMHYLKAVIKEALRLHPPVTLLPRRSTEDVNINGYDIKANTQVLVNLWQIGRDPMSYDSKPEEFEPERFLKVNSDLSYKGNDFQFIPFGAGRRRCPGIQFATSVIEIALANLVHKFDWTLPRGIRNEDLDMAESPGMTTHMKYSLEVVAIPYPTV